MNNNSPAYARFFDFEDESCSLLSLQPELNSNLNATAPLLVFNPNVNEFYLSSEAKTRLRSLKGECYIISVSGNPLIGKSSLLNLLVSLFKNHSPDDSSVLDEISFPEIYRIGDGNRSTTQWIDMFCISNNGKNFIFLDVEGDNDPNRKDAGVWIYSNLIQTAVGVSHAHLYNYHGIPQETFFNYFDSIHKLVKQNKLHSDFETKHMFLRRNHSVGSGRNPSQELDKMKLSFDSDRLNCEGIDYSLHFLTSPPEHIIERKSSFSCLSSPGYLCQDCQKDLFPRILLGIFDELNIHLQKVVPFKTSQDIIDTLEKILKINRQDLPFVLDRGHIAKIRSDSLKKSQIRIQQGILEAKQFQMERGLAKEIQQIMNDHPNLAKMEKSEQFANTQATLATKLSQLEYMMPELINFVKGYILDENASVLDENEKKTLEEIYVNSFDKFTREIVGAVKFFETVIDSICVNLEEIKQDTKTGLKAYMEASRAYKINLLTSAVGFTFSTVTGIAGRDALLGATAGTATGGLVAIGFAAIRFIQAKQKWDEIKKIHDDSLNTKKIPGIKDEKEAERELKRVEEFVTKLIMNLRESSKYLKRICHEKENINFVLVNKIKDALENKIKGKNLSADGQLELLNIMKVAQTNIEKFKKYF